MHHPDGVVARWSYADLWARSMAVARALVACDIGKDARVGILMTNRLEWVSACFGIGLAGATVVELSTFSTFSTRDELEYLLKASGVSILLYERDISWGGISVPRWRKSNLASGQALPET